MGRAEDLFERLEREGTNCIDALIATRKSEEAFLDFKRSRGDGAGIYIADDDRKNLAAALSGFGNSDGGVIIWGIGGGDAAESKHPVQNASRFASLIDGAVSGCTIPPVHGVRSIPIKLPGSEAGFVATLIPQSAMAPHQVVGRGTYNIRAGSSFVPVTHGVLAGMFGRTPRPILRPTFDAGPFCLSWSNGPSEMRELVAHLHATLKLTNVGAVLASDMYATVVKLEAPGPECECSAYSLRDTWTTPDFRDGLSFVSMPGVRLAPRSATGAVNFSFVFKPPFTRDFELEAVVGCAGSPPIELNCRGNAFDLAAAYEAAQRLFDSQANRDDLALSRVTAEVLGFAKYD